MSEWKTKSFQVRRVLLPQRFKSSCLYTNNSLVYEVGLFFRVARKNQVKNKVLLYFFPALNKAKLGENPQAQEYCIASSGIFSEKKSASSGIGNRESGIVRACVFSEKSLLIFSQAGEAALNQYSYGIRKLEEKNKVKLYFLRPAEKISEGPKKYAAAHKY